jgi:chromosome partitioning protein
LAEAPSFGQSIFQYAPDSNGADDYRRLTDELLQMPVVRELAKSA